MQKLQWGVISVDSLWRYYNNDEDCIITVQQLDVLGDEHVSEPAGPWHDLLTCVINSVTLYEPLDV